MRRDFFAPPLLDPPRGGLTESAAMAPRDKPAPRTRFAEIAMEKGKAYEAFVDALVGAGIARRTASRYWAGTTTPRLRELAIISRLLRTSADYFLGLTDEPFGIRKPAPEPAGGSGGDPSRAFVVPPPPTRKRRTA